MQLGAHSHSFSEVDAAKRHNDSSDTFFILESEFTLEMPMEQRGTASLTTIANKIAIGNCLFAKT